MTEFPPELIVALRRQLIARDAALGAGARRVGWKLGMGERERIGDSPVVGFLTSATVLPPGTTAQVGGMVAPHADAEVAVRFVGALDPSGGAAAVRSCVDACGIALELCDLGGTDDAEAIVAANVFHRGVTFGPLIEGLPPAGATAQLTSGGVVRADGEVRLDLPSVLSRVAGLLDAVGESIQAGDLVITGSVVQMPAAAGQTVAAQFSSGGSAELPLVA